MVPGVQACALQQGLRGHRAVAGSAHGGAGALLAGPVPITEPNRLRLVGGSRRVVGTSMILIGIRETLGDLSPALEAELPENARDIVLYGVEAFCRALRRARGCCNA